MKYKFSYTIVPIESIFDVDENLLDLRQPTDEEKKQFDDDKKNDFENHTKLPEIFEQEAKNKYIEIVNIEEKRKRFNELIECLPIESCFREDMIFYFKKIIISQFCLRYNFKKALFGTTSHKVATQLLG